MTRDVVQARQVLSKLTTISPTYSQQFSILKLAEMVEEERENGGMLTSPENIRVSFPGSGATTKAAQQQVRHDHFCILNRLNIM